MPDPKPPTSIVERLREDCHNPFSGRCEVLTEAAAEIERLRGLLDAAKGHRGCPACAERHQASIREEVYQCDHAHTSSGPWVHDPEVGYQRTMLCNRCPAWCVYGQPGAWRTAPRPEQTGRVQVAPALVLGWERPAMAPQEVAHALWSVAGLRAWDYHRSRDGVSVRVFADAQAQVADVAHALHHVLPATIATKGTVEFVVMVDGRPLAIRFTQLHEPWTFRHEALELPRGWVQPEIPIARGSIRPPEVTRPFNFEEARALLQASTSPPLAVPIAEMAAGYRRIWRAEEERIVRETPPGHFAVIGAPALHPGGGWGGSDAVERWVMRMAYLPAEKLPDMPAGLDPGITWHIYAVNDGAGAWAEGAAP